VLLCMVLDIMAKGSCEMIDFSAALKDDNDGPQPQEEYLTREEALERGLCFKCCAWYPSKLSNNGEPFCHAMNEDKTLCLRKVYRVKGEQC